MKACAVPGPAMAPMRSFTEIVHCSSGTPAPSLPGADFRVDYKLGKEVLFILIDTAEPVIVVTGFDAGMERILSRWEIGISCIRPMRLTTTRRSHGDFARG